MKKILLLVAVAFGFMTAHAQDALAVPTFGTGWSIGLDGGVTTPLKNHAFFGDMRGLFGLHLQKQISPTFALGVESAFGVNTSYGASKTMIDNSYVGAYGAVNLCNLLAGYSCETRPFDVEVVAGAGWGHLFYPGHGDWNYFATKAGLNFNFNVTDRFTISLKPSVVWDMSDANVSQTSAAYNANKASFNVLVGLSYKFGQQIACVSTRNQGEIDALNAQINQLRGDLDAANAATASANAQSQALAAQVQALQNRKPEVVKEVQTNNTLTSVRYVFYRIGSSVITPDQQPNVEMIANYLKKYPKATVVVKGYASKDGNEEFNIKLAAARAESVKNMLVKKYGIKADRISASGQGIGEMFSEESWNRVSICTIDDGSK